MGKIKIDLDIVLPDIPNERDACVVRIINEMKGRQGIKDVHIVPETGSSKARLCFHYNPDMITVERIQKLAGETGAEITNRYNHLFFEVKGIRHQRHTRLIEAELKSKKGILTVSVSGGGAVLIEFDRGLIKKEQILGFIKEMGLQVAGEETPLKEHDHNGGQRHEDEEHEEHGHAHGGIFGRNTEIIFSLLCGGLLGIGFALSFIAGIPFFVPLLCYVGAYLFGGYFTGKEAIEAVIHGGFEIDFLMLVAAIGAAVLGQWAEGALLLFLFSLGHSLEHYAMEKARKSITALTELAPRTALLITGAGSNEVQVEELKPGDAIQVKPNTKIPADGIVVSGTGSVNQAPITGESIPVDKMPVENTEINIEQSDRLDAKYKVFAGSINGNAMLEIKVSRLASDSTIARLVKMVNEAQTQKSPTQQFTDKIEKYFVPAVLILVVLLCFVFLVIPEPFSKSFYRAMAVLVAASPCALAIATPSAVLSGVARAARAGVLIKGGRPLEDLGTLTALAFDKTGTLTEGKPRLAKVIPLKGLDEGQLLRIIIAVETLSDHPLAKSIVKDGTEKLGNASIPPATGLQAILGKGVKAIFEGDTIFMGNLALFEALDEIQPSGDLINQVNQLQDEGNTTMLVRKNKEYIGIIAVMDTPRKEAKQTLDELRKMGIRRMIILTGDNQKVAGAIARQTGITDAWGNLLPGQKVEAIRKLKQEEEKIAMVGDGVNDAPAMANSTVGIAMGAAGSDVALETADIALMGDNLSLLPFAIKLSRKAKSIIKQNLIISLGMVVILIPLTILGLATIGPAVMAHEGSTLLVVFNALRLLRTNP